MAKVAPYHTDSPEYPPEHRNVYHDHDDCKDGKKILPRHRLNGTGGIRSSFASSESSSTPAKCRADSMAVDCGT